MENTHDILAYIGRERVAAAFKLSKRRLDEWLQYNVIPSLYYDGLERMAGRPLPRKLFTFKMPSEPPEPRLFQP
jgi:hypothetical protein